MYGKQCDEHRALLGRAGRARATHSAAQKKSVAIKGVLLTARNWNATVAFEV